MARCPPARLRPLLRERSPPAGAVPARGRSRGCSSKQCRVGPCERRARCWPGASRGPTCPLRCASFRSARALVRSERRRPDYRGHPRRAFEFACRELGWFELGRLGLNPRERRCQHPRCWERRRRARTRSPRKLAGISTRRDSLGDAASPSSASSARSAAWFRLEQRSRIEPTAAERYRVQLTAGTALEEKLEPARDRLEVAASARNERGG